MDSTVERKVKVVESRKESEWGKSRFGKDGGGGGGWKKIRRVRVKTRRERERERREAPTSITQEKEREKSYFFSSIHSYKRKDAG